MEVIILIIACSIKEMHQMDSSVADKLAIVHSCQPEQLPFGARQVKDLAPSDELFKEYRKAVHRETFTSEWFENIYVPKFLQDLSTNQNARIMLDNLCKVSYEQNILMGCFCQDSRQCHRTIVANILYGMGANIRGNDERWKYQYNLYNHFMMQNRLHIY